MLRQSIVFFSSFFFGDLKQRLGTNVCFLVPLFIVVALFTNTLLVPPCVCLCLGWLVVSTLPFSSVIFCSVPFASHVMFCLLRSSLFISSLIFLSSLFLSLHFFYSLQVVFYVGTAVCFVVARTLLEPRKVRLRALLFFSFFSSSFSSYLC